MVVLEDESQPVELSCPCIQVPTLASVWYMWMDFAMIVKDLNSSTVVGVTREEGWISVKRGCGNPINFIEDK